MKGLLIKDFKLLFGQKRFFIAVCFFGLFFIIMNENPISGMSYVTMLFSIFTLSTISYDEYDNGMLFLMTLPINRKLYVGEKYAFAGIITLASAVVSSVIAFGAAKVMDVSIDIKELLVAGAVVMAFAGLMLAFTIPIELKFGAEKGRVAMILVMGVLFGSGLLLVKGGAYLGTDITEIFTKIMVMDEKILAGVAFIIWSILIFASYMVCVNIVKKKEF